MKEQLEQLGYTQVEAVETKNGVGYVGIKDGGSIIIPPNYEKTDGLSMLVCGQDGTGNAIYGTKFSQHDDSSGDTIRGPQLIVNAQNGEFPGNAVVIAPNDLYPNYSNTRYRPNPADDLGANVLNDAYTLLKSNGANITNVGVQSFSNGGPGSMLALGGFLELNPNANIKTKVVLCDTYNVEQIVSLYDKQKLNYVDEGKINAMNAIINNNTEIYSLNWTSPKKYNNHANNVTALSKYMTEKGFNYQFSKSSRLSHASYMTDFFEGGGLDFLTGNGSLNLNNKYYSGFYRYDSQGNEVVAAIASGIYQSLSVTASTNYNYLLNATSLMPTNGNISSDTLYVYEQMNKLRDQIKQSKFLTSNSKQVFSNPNSIPGCISAYIDAYYNIMGELMDSLMKETEVIASIASTIDNMGRVLKTEAEELSFGEMPQHTILANSSSPVSNQKSTSEYNENTSGNYESQFNTSEIEQKMREHIHITKDSPGKILKPFNTSEIEQKMRERVVKERPDGSKMEFSIDEDKVVGLKYVYEFSSDDEALSNMAVLQKKFSDVDYVLDIKVLNKNVEIIFKDDSYNNMTSDEIINKYLNGGN